MLHNKGNITLKRAKELLKLADNEIKEWKGFKKEIIKNYKIK